MRFGLKPGFRACLHTLALKGGVSSGPQGANSKINCPGIEPRTGSGQSS